MPKDRKGKVIFAIIIALAFIIANLFSNNILPDVFNKKDDELILEDTTAHIEEKEEDLSEENHFVDKKVYITGEINKPGVYEIRDDERLDDLVKRAGGLKEEADVNNINLALKLEDQMKIYIPNKNENLNTDTGYNVLTTDQNKSTNSKININTASKEELMTLPNIGEKRAQAILDYRQEQRFDKIEDIKNIRGIGDKFFEALKDLITV